MKLNLGCGHNKIADHVNVDRETIFNPDVLCDLELRSWPFADNSAETVTMHHVLEHLGQAPTVFCDIMREIYRVLAPGGELSLRVPHHRSDTYFGDPTHVRPITPQLLSLFSKRNCEDFVAKHWPNTPLALYLGIDLELTHTNFVLTPYWAHKWSNKMITKDELDYAMSTYNNVVDEVAMTLVKVS